MSSCCEYETIKGSSMPELGLATVAATLVAASTD
jgi:hypothetical protein